MSNLLKAEKNRRKLSVQVIGKVIYPKYYKWMFYLFVFGQIGPSWQYWKFSAILLKYPTFEVNLTKPGTVLIETLLSGDSLYKIRVSVHWKLCTKKLIDINFRKQDRDLTQKAMLNSDKNGYLRKNRPIFPIFDPLTSCGWPQWPQRWLHQNFIYPILT